MTFEQQIAQAFETLTERLRGEIGQHVQRTAAELSAAAPRDRAPVDAGAAPPPAAADAPSRARLAEGFAAIDRARSLTAVLDALLTFARADGVRADVWLSRGGRLHQWRAADSAEAAQDTPAGSIALPLTIAGTAVAFLYADGPAGTQNEEGRAENLELVTRYASKSLEALTAFTTARALTQPAQTAGAPADGADSEEDTSARRYARLLVSEIKLYHEPAVIDGRRDRDLAVRLGGEIARARVMYEQRVPMHVRERADYFQDELVKTLANGDSSLLDVRT